MLAEQQITLIFGGGKVGLMGAIADSVLAHGGAAVGVIPQSLVQREVAHASLTELHVVATMHERKALMARLADAFVALPGGFGTFDELCEIITWNQLGILQKPVALYNVNGYFDKWLEMTTVSVDEGFVHAAQRDRIIIADQPEILLQQLQTASKSYASNQVDLERI